MAVNYVTIKGYVRDGRIEVDLPDDVIEGEIEVKVPVERDMVSIEEPQPLWTDEELAELIKPDPKTGAEIIALGHTGGWEHKGIEDSVEWVQELRRQRRENRGW
jgi:hypothetical protein